MNRLKRFSLIILGTLIFTLCPFVFTGCKDENKNSKLYVFATIGGYVQVDDHKEIVEFGDEGSKIFTYKKQDIVKLKAVANDGYAFVKWQFSDGMEKEYENIIDNAEIEIKLLTDEVVVKALFEEGEPIAKYTITYPTSATGYEIEVVDGYSATVNANGEFKFKVNLDEDYSNSQITVKANSNEIVADAEGVYTISNIDEDVAITVEGVELNEEEPTPTPIIYGVFEQDEKFNIVPVGQADCNVEEGNGFKFKIEISDLSKYKFGDNVVVETDDGTVLNKNSDGEYEIDAVNKNIQITVSGIEIITYTISKNDDRFIIHPTSQQSYIVESGNSFTFTFEVVEGYKLSDNITVKAFGTEEVEVIKENNGRYTISSVTEDIVITIDGIIAEGEELYEFVIVFEESVLEVYPELAEIVPQNITIKVTEEQKVESCKADEFTVLEDGEVSITIAELVKLINDYTIDEVDAFTLNGIDFIKIDGEYININWEVLEVADETDLVVKFK